MKALESHASHPTSHSQRPDLPKDKTRADPLRNPTLSYTQRLEERIKDLEEQVSKAQAQAHAPPQPQRGLSEGALSSSHESSIVGHESEGLAGTFKGLKLDEKGVITYHGATSFFHLPSEYGRQSNDAPSPSNPEDPLYGKRERLVNNAWQQRALEDLSEIPVRIPVFPSAFHRERLRLTHLTPGTVPISAQHALVLDPTSVELCLSSDLHPRYATSWTVLLTYPTERDTLALDPVGSLGQGHPRSSRERL